MKYKTCKFADYGRTKVIRCNNEHKLQNTKWSFSRINFCPFCGNTLLEL